MIKIYINARFLTQTVTGVQRYALELVKEIDQLIERGKLTETVTNFVYCPLPIFLMNQLSHICASKWLVS